MNNRIQVLRGIAIISVVLIHTNLTGMAGVITRPFMNFAVALFIFISGYLTDLHIPNWFYFMKKRLIKVIVPYILWSIIYEIIVGSFNDFISKLLTGRCSSVYYYIFIYSLFVLFTPLINRLLKSKFYLIGYFITPISLIITRYIVAINNVTLPLGSSSFLFTNWFIYYYFGLALGNKKIQNNIATKKALTIYIICLAISIIEGLIWYQYGNYDMATTQLRITSVLTSLSFIIIMHKYISNDVILNVNNKIIKYLERILTCIGNCSFGIYLSHMIIIYVVNKVIFIRTLPFMIYSVVIVLISTICVILGRKILTNKFSWLLGL